MTPGPALLAHLTTLSAAMLSQVFELVRHESPSRDKAALDALATRLGQRFRDLGAEVERIPNAEGGDHLRMRFGNPEDATPPALVLGHFDTVWPSGTIAGMPCRVEEGRAHGPGIFDMKANLVSAGFALRALGQLSLRPPRPVELLFTSDEEIGSPTSRSWIEAAARRAAYVLVPEPPLKDGGLKTARKGVGRFTLSVTGRAAHAGVEPEKGVNAVVELAHQILAIGSLANASAGTTLNVGRVEGGTTPNVVPAHARAVIDVRASTTAEARRIKEALLRLKPVLPGAGLSVEGGFNRPPMERTGAIGRLFVQARTLGETLGLSLTEGATGGGSDGNFTAALGIPTLDGLGVPGGGAHADDEHILIDGLPTRSALLALLLLSL